MGAKLDWLDQVCGPRDNTGQLSNVFKGGIRMLLKGQKNPMTKNIEV